MVRGVGIDPKPALIQLDPAAHHAVLFTRTAAAVVVIGTRAFRGTWMVEVAHGMTYLVAGRLLVHPFELPGLVHPVGPRNVRVGRCGDDGIPVTVTVAAAHRFGWSAPAQVTQS